MFAVTNKLTTEAGRDNRRGWCVVGHEYPAANQIPVEALV
jgi:hypothetical protein